MTSAELIIIGAGPGGYETAARAAASGLDVIIIERDNLGGTCLNRGCIPTKTLCASADTVESVRHAGEFGIITTPPRVDFNTVMTRKDEIVNQLRQGVEMALKGVTIVKGQASITAAHTVMVGQEEYSAPRIIIATGSAPAIPPIVGSELAVTSDGLLEMTNIPSSLIIIGGGVIGMEFASVFRSFGAEVTVIEYCREIIPALDSEVAKRLRTALKKRGINIITSAAVKEIRETNGCLAVEYDEKGKSRTAEAAVVAIATGRKAVIPDGFTEAGGMIDSRGFITVDETYATNLDGIYAIGDVNGLCMLAHAATAQGLKFLGENVNTDVIPSAIFTHPECGAVGLTEDQCKATNRDYVVGKSTFRANGKAVTAGETEGMVKVIADCVTGKILGCHICGAEAAILIQEVALAMSAGLTCADLKATVHPHPTLSEAVLAAIP